MGWSWLGLFLGLFLPPCLFTAAYFWRFRRQSINSKVLAGIVLMCAAVASLTVLLFAFYVAPQWAKGVRIVWTDMRTDNTALAIGGDPNEAIVGWPTSTYETNETGPALHADPNEGTQGTLVITGGDGFIFDQASQRILNGTPVKVGETAKFGNYSIRVNHLGWRITHPLTKQLEVLDAAEKSLAGFDLVKDRTRSMRYLLPAHIDAALFTKERAGDRDQIDEWSAGIWLLRTDHEQIYVLERTSKNELRYPLPTRLSLVARWSNLSLPFTLDLERQVSTLYFSSPWRFSVPLPPKAIEGCKDENKGKKDLAFVLTSHPRPCEIALALPFGAGQEKISQEAAVDSFSRKFSSPGAIDNEMPPNCPPGARCEQERIGLSRYAVRQGNHTFGLAVVEDMPSLRWSLVLIAGALLFLAWGLWLMSERFPRTNLWLVYGLVLVVWSFLSFRLMLAFRYALDPSALDALAVSGVTRAFFALMVIPGVLLLLSRIRCDHYEKPAEQRSASRAFRRTWTFFLALWFIAFPVSLYLPSRLVWPNLPDSYHFTISTQSLPYFLGLWLAPLLLISIYLIRLYDPNSSDSLFLKPWTSWHAEEADKLESETYELADEDEALDDKRRNRFVLLKEMFRLVVRSIVVFLLLFSPWRWAEQSYFKSAKSSESWRRTLGSWSGFARYLLLFIVRFAVFSLIWVAARFLFPGDKLVQELSVPILFYWLALDWIGLAMALNAGEPEKVRWVWLRLGLLAIVTISMPAVLLPLLMGDFGSILPVLAIVFPLAAILLLVGKKRSSLSQLTLGQRLRSLGGRRAGLAMIVAIIVLFGSGYLFYENLTGFLNLPIINKEGRVFARLLNFKYGSQAQRWALTANSFVGGEGVPFQELLNGNQHAWENKAIAHLGGWTGEGYGKAPTRLSHVRQDTLQYDSAFSFFVVSEYGFMGGVLLLVMYSLPLLLFLIGARDHFDAGYAIAIIVASSFLIEGLYHAGMNWGVFPITGRNLPLLSVNSPSDLFKWTILFGFALQTIFWRYQGSGSISEESESLLPGAEERADEDVTEGVRLRGWHFALSSLLILLFPVLTFTSVVWSGLGVCRDKQNEFEAFTYKPLLDDARWYLDNKVVEYVEDQPGSGRRLVAHEDKLKDPDAREFILQEVYRFNSRNVEGQLEAINSAQLEHIRTGLGNVRDLSGYNRFLESIRRAKSPRPRPSLFRLRSMRDEDGSIKDYRIEVNDDFNVRFRFRHQNSPRDLPKLRYGDAELIGPSWINGRYETVIASNEDLAQDKSHAALAEIPWVAHLASAMEAEWQRLGANAAADSYQGLTLDPALQEKAGNFIAEKGISLHRELLSRPTQDFSEKLPPRVAISILSLPDGEVRSLGSWPRMTTTQTVWKKATLTIAGDNVSAWIPSATWLDKDAPIVLKRRYEGDRNFERTLVMGSITKPIWASAVMKIHPNLDRLLRVSPSSEDENEVFGLRIPGPVWNLNSHVNDWIRFDEFLRYSDNRYQVRTGMLGLAEKDGDGFMAGQYSGSPVESLSGQNKSWGKEPQFSSAVTIDRDRSKGTITKLNLANTDLGKYLHDMYSVGVKDQQNWSGRQARAFVYRRSFWTLNERDDDLQFDSKASWLLDLISPQAPDFYFDRLDQPRDFITMLLGGRDNRWANVDLAAAFASCITGKPVLAHIIKGNGLPQPLEARKTALDPRVAMKVRNGLNQAVELTGGTAHLLWVGDDLGFLKGRVKVYAKTGTLKPEGDVYETSRIALALIKWKDERRGEVANGLVFTVVAEQGKQGTATRWLKDFITENKTEIAKILKL